MRILDPHRYSRRFRWTLRRRILVGQGAVLLLLAVICAIGYLRIERLGRASAGILRENYRSILAAENMIDALERQDSALLLLVLGRTAEGVDQFHENETRFLTWFARARDNVTIASETRILDRIQGSYREYLESYDALRLAASSSTGEPGRIYDTRALPAFGRIRRACAELRRTNEMAMFDASAHAERLARNGVLSLLLIGGGAIAFGIVFSLVLATFLMRPLQRLVVATQRIAAGDYDVTLPEAGSDEIGRLSKEFNEMARQLLAYHDMNVERVVAEKQRSDAVLRSIDDGLLLLDDTLLVRRINPSAGTALGIRPEEAVGHHLLEVVQDERFLDTVRRAAAGNGPRPGTEAAAEDVLAAGRAEGERFYQYSVTPVTLDTGGRIGVVVVLRDVTKLRELDRLKSEFVMTASHELRTPLTSIEMSLDLLRERAADVLRPRERELLEAAREDVERLDRLVEGLLDLTRIESGRIEMQIKAVSIDRVLARIRSIFGVQFEEKGVTLEVLPVAPGLYSRADVEKVEWVLTNLVSNALRYTDSGGRVEVSAERMGRWISISVGDSGEGIPLEHQSRVFDRFVQLDSRHGPGGAGLGCPIRE